MAQVWRGVVHDTMAQEVWRRWGGGVRLYSSVDGTGSRLLPSTQHLEQSELTPRNSTIDRILPLDVFFKASPFLPAEGAGTACCS